MHPGTTIAAISTAPGEAGIAVVRISGPDSLTLADSLFVCKGPPPSQRRPNTFVYGSVVRKTTSGEPESLDNALLLVFHAPHSYTGEDTVELQSHGGPVCAQRILRAALDAGASPAEPGEFTKRAFLNGRMDLLQAEAVADLIRARSDRAATAALAQMEGALSRRLNSLYDSILAIAADMEARLDFSEEELPLPDSDATLSQLDETIRRLEDLLSTWNEGRILREGAKFVIAGRPNVGKSTLLNRLLGHDRAIVADTPGTTRDTLEESIIIAGHAVRLVDTAGIRESDCSIEREGVRRSQRELDDADAVIYVMDASQPLCSADRDHLAKLDKRRTILVLNKSDLGQRLVSADFPGFLSQSCSLSTDSSAAAVRVAIKSCLLQITGPEHSTSISERHRQLLQYAVNDVSEVRQLVLARADFELAICACCLRGALEHLGLMTGRTYTDELLDSIFTRFCIGK